MLQARTSKLQLILLLDTNWHNNKHNLNLKQELTIYVSFCFFCGATPNLNMNVENKFVYNIKHASLTRQNDKLFYHHKKYVLA